ncbi:toxin glutamine deamidase domain-containing protein [Lentzea sp. E54]|uniref:WXG100-like domain-containing protein n=1 Tax=Lentzea xerophila TaxID=3435883 RepID=UPI003DA1E42F
MVPDEVRVLFQVLSGEEWPDADEDKLRALADAWENAANRLTGDLAPQLKHAVTTIRTTFHGQAERAFATRMSPFVEGEDNYLSIADEQFRGLAKFLRDLALDVEYVKLVSVLTIVSLIAEMAWAVAMAFWTGGASMTWLAARMAVVRYLLQTLIGRLVINFAQAMVFGIAFQVLIDALAQGIQYAMRTRTSWNTQNTVNAVGVGALGAALAVPLGGLGKIASGLATKGLDDVLGKVAGGRDWHKDLPDIINEIGMEAFQETFTEGLYTYITEGSFEMNPFSATSGAVSGATSVIGSEIGDALAGSSGPAADFTGDGPEGLYADAGAPPAVEGGSPSDGPPPADVVPIPVAGVVPRSGMDGVGGGVAVGANHRAIDDIGSRGAPPVNGAAPDPSRAMPGVSAGEPAVAGGSRVDGADGGAAIGANHRTIDDIGSRGAPPANGAVSDPARTMPGVSTGEPAAAGGSGVDGPGSSGAGTPAPVSGQSTGITTSTAAGTPLAPPAGWAGTTAGGTGTTAGGTHAGTSRGEGAQPTGTATGKTPVAATTAPGVGAPQSTGATVSGNTAQPASSAPAGATPNSTKTPDVMSGTGAPRPVAADSSSAPGTTAKSDPSAGQGSNAPKGSGGAPGGTGSVPRTMPTATAPGSGLKAGVTPPVPQSAAASSATGTTPPPAALPTTPGAKGDESDAGAPVASPPPAPPLPPTRKKDGEKPARQVRSGGAPPRMTPPTPDSHQGKDVITDESWLHDTSRTADWSEPDNPAARSTWEKRRNDTDKETVDLDIGDIRSDSTPSTPKVLPGPIKYDLRRIETTAGKFVQEYTVKVYLDPAEGVTQETIDQVKRNARSGVDSLLNQGFRLPSGDQFHLYLDFDTNPVDAHTIITVDPGKPIVDQTHWRPDTSPAVLAHEALHYLGIPDEYQDSGRALQQHDTNSRVHQNDGGMMGTDLYLPGAGILPRHLWLIERTANNQVMVRDTRLGPAGPATVPPPANTGATTGATSNPATGSTQGSRSTTDTEARGAPKRERSPASDSDAGPKTKPPGKRTPRPAAGAEPDPGGSNSDSDVDMNAEPYSQAEALADQLGTMSITDIEAGTRYNEAFARLADGRIEVPTKDTYLAKLKESVEGDKRPSFVVNMIVSHSQLNGPDVDLAKVIDAVTKDAGPIGEDMVFVIGVNGPAGSDTAITSSIDQASNAVAHRTEPIALVPLPTFDPKGGFPFGTMRNETMHSSATTFAIGAMNGKDTHPYISFQDFDAGSRKVTGDQIDIFNHFTNSLNPPDAGPIRPLLYSGGYRVGDPDALIRDTQARIDNERTKINDSPQLSAKQKAELKELDIAERQLRDPGGFVAKFQQAMNDDMDARNRQKDSAPLLPYSPEPNLFLDANVAVVDPGVKFSKDGNEFGGLSQSINEFAGKELVDIHTNHLPKPVFNQDVAEAMAQLEADIAARGGTPSPAQAKVLASLRAEINAKTIAAADPAFRHKTEKLVVDAGIAVDMKTNRNPYRGENFSSDFVNGAVATDLSRLALGFARSEGKSWPQSHVALTSVTNRMYGGDTPSADRAAKADVSGAKIRDEFQDKKPGDDGAPNPKNKQHRRRESQQRITHEYSYDPRTGVHTHIGSQGGWNPSGADAKKLGTQNKNTLNAAVSAPIDGHGHMGIDPAAKQEKMAAMLNLALSANPSNVTRMFGTLEHGVLPIAGAPRPDGLYHAVHDAMADVAPSSKQGNAAAELKPAADLRAGAIQKGAIASAAITRQIANFRQEHGLGNGHLVTALIEPGPAPTTGVPATFNPRTDDPAADNAGTVPTADERAENARTARAEELAAKLLATEIGRPLTIHGPDGVKAIEPFYEPKPEITSKSSEAVRRKAEKWSKPVFPAPLELDARPNPNGTTSYTPHDPANPPQSANRSESPREPTPEPQSRPAPPRPNHDTPARSAPDAEIRTEKVPTSGAPAMSPPPASRHDGTTQEQRDDVTRREIADRIAAMGLDPVRAVATFNGLTTLGSVQNHVADVLSSPGVQGPVARISAAVASLGPEQAERVRGLVTDALVSTSAVPVRHRLVGDITKLNFGHVHDWRSVRPLTPSALEKTLARMAADVEAGRAPLPDLPHRATDPLPRRLAVLETLNLLPQVRTQLFAHPPFAALLDSPQLADALFGGKGLDEQRFLNTCEPAVVNTGLRSTLPTIFAQVHAGRAVADSVQQMLDFALAKDPEPLAKKDKPGGRTVEQLVRDRIAEARATFDRLEAQAGTAAPDWAALSDDWGRVLQKLSAVVDPSEGADSIPVVSRKLIGGAWGLSAVLALPLGVDRPGRRGVGVTKDYRVTAEQVLAGSAPLGRPKPLSDSLGDGFWSRLHRNGTLPVTLVGRFTSHVVSVQAIRHEGAEAYLIGDPKKKHFDLVTPDEFGKWAESNNAEAVLPPVVTMSNVHPVTTSGTAAPAPARSDEPAAVPSIVVTPPPATAGPSDPAEGAQPRQDGDEKQPALPDSVTHDGVDSPSDPKIEAGTELAVLTADAMMNATSLVKDVETALNSDVEGAGSKQYVHSDAGTKLLHASVVLHTRTDEIAAMMRRHGVETVARAFNDKFERPIIENAQLEEFDLSTDAGNTAFHGWARQLWSTVENQPQFTENAAELADKVFNHDKGYNRAINFAQAPMLDALIAPPTVSEAIEHRGRPGSDTSAQALWLFDVLKDAKLIPPDTAVDPEQFTAVVDQHRTELHAAGLQAGTAELREELQSYGMVDDDPEPTPADQAAPTSSNRGNTDEQPVSGPPVSGPTEPASPNPSAGVAPTAAAPHRLEVDLGTPFVEDLFDEIDARTSTAPRPVDLRDSVEWRIPDDTSPLTPDRLEREFGIPKTNQERFQNFVDRFNIVLDIRPTNPESVRWLHAGAMPKPKDIKSKTINQTDVLLGADARYTGLVGFFQPNPPSKSSGIDPETQEKAAKRFDERTAEFAELISTMKEYEQDGKFKVIDGVVHGVNSRGDFIWLTGDADMYGMYDADGNRLGKEDYEGTVFLLVNRNVGVQHGAHLYWDPVTDFDRKIFDAVVAKHVSDEPLVRFNPGQPPSLVLADPLPARAGASSEATRGQGSSGSASEIEGEAGDPRRSDDSAAPEVTATDDSSLTPEPHSGAPKPQPLIANDYRFAGDPLPFTANQPYALVQGTGFPAFTTPSADLTFTTPPLRLSGDGSLAINGVGTVAAAGTTVTQAREFFATSEVLEQARVALHRAQSSVELVTEGPEVIVTADNGQQTVLHRVVPRFTGRMPDICRDMAQEVTGSPFNALVLRGQDGRPVLAPVDTTSGIEVSGTHHLAEQLAELAQGDAELDATGPQWAASVINLDEDPAVDAPGRPRPGLRYGAALSHESANDRARQRMDDLARRTGINQFASAKPGEAFIVSSISSTTADGNRELQVNAARGDTSAHPYGYHFAGVVARSSDGTVITLENYRRGMKAARLIDEAVATNLAHHGPQLESIAADLDSEIAAASRQGDTAADLQAKKTLATALIALRDAGENPPPAVRKSAARAMQSVLKLPRFGDQWYFRMYREAPGETFYDQWAVLYDTNASTNLTNPLVSIAAGGYQRIAPVRVWFDPRSKEIAPDQHGGTKAVAKQVARAALWRQENGLPLPTVTVTGYGQGGRGGRPRAVATGRQRAATMAALFRRELETALDELQEGRPTVRVQDIGIEIRGAVEAASADGDNPNARRAELHIEFENPAAEPDSVERPRAPQRTDSDDSKPSEATSHTPRHPAPEPQTRPAPPRPDQPAGGPSWLTEEYTRETPSGFFDMTATPDQEWLLDELEPEAPDDHDGSALENDHSDQGWTSDDLNPTEAPSGFFDMTTAPDQEWLLDELEPEAPEDHDGSALENDYPDQSWTRELLAAEADQAREWAAQEPNDGQSREQATEIVARTAGSEILGDDQVRIDLTDVIAAELTGGLSYEQAEEYAQQIADDLNAEQHGSGEQNDPWANEDESSGSTNYRQARAHLRAAKADPKLRMFMMEVAAGAFTGKRGAGGRVTVRGEELVDLRRSVAEFRELTTPLRSAGGQPVTVYRAVRMAQEARADDVFVERLPSSTTHELDFAKAWTENRGGGRNYVIFEMSVPAGHRTMALSYPAGERGRAGDPAEINAEQSEVVVGPTRLRVTGRREEDGYTIISVGAEELSVPEIDALLSETGSTLPVPTAFELLSDFFGDKDKLRNAYPDMLGDAVIEASNGPDGTTTTISKPGADATLSVEVTTQVLQGVPTVSVSISDSSSNASRVLRFDTQNLDTIATDLQDGTLENSETFESLIWPFEWYSLPAAHTDAGLSGTGAPRQPRAAQRRNSDDFEVLDESDWSDGSDWYEVPTADAKNPDAGAAKKAAEAEAALQAARASFQAARTELRAARDEEADASAEVRKSRWRSYGITAMVDALERQTDARARLLEAKRNFQTAEQNLGAASRDRVAHSTGVERPAPRSIIDDESWLHSDAPAAAWSRPLKPVSQADIERHRDRAPVAKVNTIYNDARDRNDKGKYSTPQGPLYSFEGLLAYDMRRFTVDGVPVRDLTVKVHLDLPPSVTRERATDLQTRVRAGVDDFYNRGHRLPSGEQLHVTVQFVSAKDAHGTIEIVDTAGRHRSSQQEWWIGASKQTFAHEIGHFLGLGDEYQDSSTISRKGATSSGVHHDHAPMTVDFEASDAEIKPRNLWKIERRALGTATLPEPASGNYRHADPRPQQDTDPLGSSDLGSDPGDVDPDLLAGVDPAVDLDTVDLDTVLDLDDAAFDTVFGLNRAAAPSQPQQAGAQPEAPARRPLPAFVREGKALGTILPVEVNGGAEVEAVLTELLPPREGVTPEGVEKVGSALAQDFESFLDDGRDFPIKVGKRWYEATVQAVRNLPADTGVTAPATGPVVNMTAQSGSATGTADTLDAGHDVGLSGFVSAGVGPYFWAAGRAALARPVQSMTAGTSTTDQRVIRTGDVSTTATVPATYVVTLTDEHGNQVGQRTVGSDVTLRIPGELNTMTPADPSLRPAAAPEPAVWNHAVPEAVVDVDTRQAFAAAQKRLHPSITKLGAPGRTTLKDFLNPATIRDNLGAALQGWVLSPDLVSPHGSRAGVVRMRAIATQVELVGTNSTAALRLHESLATATGVSASTSRGGEVGSGFGGGAVLPHQVGGMAGAVGGYAAKISTNTNTGNTSTVKAGVQVKGDTGLYRVAMDLEIETPHGDTIRVPSTGYVRLGLAEAAAAGMPVPPGTSPSLTVPTPAPKFPPPYLAAALAAGNAKPGVLPQAAEVQKQVEDALRALPGFDRFLPAFADPASNPRGIGKNAQDLAGMTGNQRKLATELSPAAQGTQMDSLLGAGIPIQLKRRGFFTNDYINVTVKAKARNPVHLGQVNQRNVRNAATASPVLDSSTTTQKSWTAGVEGRTVIPTVPGSASVTPAPIAGVKYTSAEAVKSAAGPTAGSTSLDTGSPDAQVFRYDIDYEVEITRFSRSRAWVRRLTPDSPATEVPVPVTVARTGAGLPPIGGKVDFWVSDSSTMDADPTPFTPGVPTTRPLPKRITIKELLGAKKAEAPQFLHVEAVTNTEALRDAFVGAFGEAADGDNVLTVPGTPSRNRIDKMFSPEKIKANLRTILGTGMQEGGLKYSRRIKDRTGAIALSLELSKPTFVAFADSTGNELSHVGGFKSGDSTTDSRSVDFIAAVNTAVKAATDAVATATARVTAKWTPWSKTSTEGRELGGSVERNKVTPPEERKVLVQFDGDFTGVVETRSGNILRKGTTRYGGAVVTLPGGVFLQVSEQVARDLGVLPTPVPPDTTAGPAVDVTMAPPSTLVPGQPGSLGLGAVENLSDLSDLAPLLRAELGELGADLLPESVLDDSMNNLRRLTDLTSGADVEALVDSALDGGIPLLLHKPGVFDSDSYQVTLKATLGEPVFVNVVNDGVDLEQTITGLRTSSEGRGTGSGWSATLWTPAVGMPPKDGENVAGSAGGAFAAGGGQVYSNSATDSVTEQVSHLVAGTGPAARYAVPVTFELVLEKGDEVVGRVSTGTGRTLSVRLLADYQKITGRSVVLPVRRTTDRSPAHGEPVHAEAWQKAHLPGENPAELPPSATVVSERVAAALQGASVRALTHAGATAEITGKGTAPRYALQAALSSESLQANLLGMRTGAVEVPGLHSADLFGGEHPTLRIYAKAVNPRLEGLSDGVNLDDSTTVVFATSNEAKHTESGDVAPSAATGGASAENPDVRFFTRGVDVRLAGEDSAAVTGGPTHNKVGSVATKGRTGLVRYDFEFRVVAGLGDGKTGVVDLFVPGAADVPLPIEAAEKALGRPLPPELVAAQTALKTAADSWRKAEVAAGEVRRAAETTINRLAPELARATAADQRDDEATQAAQRVKDQILEAETAYAKARQDAGSQQKLWWQAKQRVDQLIDTFNVAGATAALRAQAAHTPGLEALRAGKAQSLLTRTSGASGEVAEVARDLFDFLDAVDLLDQRDDVTWAADPTALDAAMRSHVEQSLVDRLDDHSTGRLGLTEQMLGRLVLAARAHLEPGPRQDAFHTLVEAAVERAGTRLDEVTTRDRQDQAGASAATVDATHAEFAAWRNERYEAVDARDRTLARLRALAGLHVDDSVVAALQPLTISPDESSPSVAPAQVNPDARWDTQRLQEQAAQARTVLSALGLMSQQNLLESARQIAGFTHDSRAFADEAITSVIALELLGDDDVEHAIEFSRQLAADLGTTRSTPLVSAGAGPQPVVQIDRRHSIDTASSDAPDHAVPAMPPADQMVADDAIADDNASLAVLDDAASTDWDSESAEEELTPEQELARLRRDSLPNFLALLRPLKDHAQNAVDRETRNIDVYVVADIGSDDRLRNLAGDVGHAWVTVRLPRGPELAFGFGPTRSVRGYGPLTPFVRVVGGVRSETPREHISTESTRLVGPYNINADQLVNGYLYALANFEHKYNLAGYNCVSFARGFLEAAAGIRPSLHITLPRRLIKSLSRVPAGLPTIDSPAASTPQSRSGTRSGSEVDVPFEETPRVLQIRNAAADSGSTTEDESSHRATPEPGGNTAAHRYADANLASVMDQLEELAQVLESRSGSDSPGTGDDGSSLDDQELETMRARLAALQDGPDPVPAPVVAPTSTPVGFTEGSKELDGTTLDQVHHVGGALYAELKHLHNTNQPFPVLRVVGYGNSRLHASRTGRERAGVVRDALLADLRSRQDADPTGPDLSGLEVDAVSGGRHHAPRGEGTNVEERRRSAVIDILRPAPPVADWTVDDLRAQAAQAHVALSDVGPRQHRHLNLRASFILAQTHDLPALFRPGRGPRWEDVLTVVSQAYHEQGIVEAIRRSEEIARSFGTALPTGQPRMADADHHEASSGDGAPGRTDAIAGPWPSAASPTGDTTTVPQQVPAREESTTDSGPAPTGGQPGSKRSRDEFEAGSGPVTEPAPRHVRPLPERLVPPSPEDIAALLAVVPPGTRFSDPSTWLTLINGDRSASGRDVNCLDAALAFHATYHGMPRVAGTAASGGLPGGTGTAASEGTPYAPEFIGRGQIALAEVIDRVTRGGHGSDALLITFPREGAGHAWNVVNHHGTVSVVDAQAGTMQPASENAIEGLDRVYAIPMDANQDFISRAPAAAPSVQPEVGSEVVAEYERVAASPEPDWPAYLAFLDERMRFARDHVERAGTEASQAERDHLMALTLHHRDLDIHRMRAGVAAGDDVPVHGTTGRLVPSLAGLRLVGAVIAASAAADLASMLGRDVIALVFGSNAEEPRALRFPPKGRPLPVTA